MTILYIPPWLCVWCEREYHVGDMICACIRYDTCGFIVQDADQCSVVVYDREYAVACQK